MTRAAVVALALAFAFLGCGPGLGPDDGWAEKVAQINPHDAGTE